MRITQVEDTIVRRLLVVDTETIIVQPRYNEKGFVRELRNLFMLKQECRKLLRSSSAVERLQFLCRFEQVFKTKHLNMMRKKEAGPPLPPRLGPRGDAPALPPRPVLHMSDYFRYAERIELDRARSWYKKAMPPYSVWFEALFDHLNNGGEPPVDELSELLINKVREYYVVRFDQVVAETLIEQLDGEVVPLPVISRIGRGRNPMASDGIDHDLREAEVIGFAYYAVLHIRADIDTILTPLFRRGAFKWDVDVLEFLVRNGAHRDLLLEPLHNPGSLDYVHKAFDRQNRFKAPKLP